MSPPRKKAKHGPHQREMNRRLSARVGRPRRAAEVQVDHNYRQPQCPSSDPVSGIRCTLDTHPGFPRHKAVTGPNNRLWRLIEWW